MNKKNTDLNLFLISCVIFVLKMVLVTQIYAII